MASPKQRTFTLSNFRRVRNTENPFDDALPDTLRITRECYMADPIAGGGVYQRPGRVRWGSIANGGNPGQAVYCHTGTNGTHYNFFFVNGKVWRQATDLTSAPVDVTPTGVTIGTAKFVYVTSLADQIVVNDGVNIPWLGSDLGSTPITGTPIDYQTASVLLSIGSTDTQVANAAFTYLLSGTNYSKTATAAGTALPAGTIPMNTWGVYRVSVVAGGTITVTAGAANYTTGYASEALAIAALPALPASSWDVGYFTVLTEVGATFVAGTDALQGGVSGNPSSDTNYYAGAAPPWTAFGQPVIYTGAVFFILSTVEGVGQRTTIAWSEPNQPNVGYQQTGYDNAWTLTQTSTEPLFALAPTNDALYYFRALSIGAITGAPNVNFQNTATHDVVAANVGCTLPATICTFLNYVYFLDANGRPYRFAIGGAPEPIWRQSPVRFASTSPVGGALPGAWAVVEPNLNVCLFTRGTATTADTLTDVFDAATGIYMGQWGSGLFEACGVMKDSDGEPHLAALRQDDGGLAYCWRQARIWDDVWDDNGTPMTITIQTGFLGYTMSAVYTYPRARMLVNTSSGLTAPTIALRLITSQGGQTLEGDGYTAGQAAGDDWRLTWMVNRSSGRGASLSFTGTSDTWDNQLQVFGIELEGVPSEGGIDDR